MPKDITVLYRAYAPHDLAPHLQRHGIDGTVVVQAAASVEETEYMLGLADASSLIKGVVGWVNFEDESHLAHLKRFAAHPKFCGVRRMIQARRDQTNSMTLGARIARVAVLQTECSGAHAP